MRYFVVTQDVTVLEHVACKHNALLIRWDTYLVMDLSPEVLNDVAGFHIVEGDGFSC
jgi:hypothetical protein